MDAVHGSTRLLQRGQPHCDVDAANDKDALLGFHLTRDVNAVVTR